MSVIGRKPYVNKIISLCSSEQVNQVISLMDNLNTLTPVRVSLYEQDILISSANLGISYVNLFMEQLTAKVIKGILVYIDNDNCGFFGVASNSDIIEEFKIDPVHYTFDKIREYLTVEELRQVCGDAFNGGGSILPEATKSGQVLVSNDQNEFEVVDEVPLADNLTPSPITNDALYSYGPTGGSLDIATGQEAYLGEVKGYTIIWNQLLGPNINYVTTDKNRIYIRVSKNDGELTLLQNTATTVYSSNYNLFDLTLMFGGNDKIPFSLTTGTTPDYPTNGTIPSQIYEPIFGFARLFSNVDLLNAPYDTGTPKNVCITKLIETGQNLWDASTMDGDNGTGCKLLAGYRYEMYIESGDRNACKISYNNGQSWSGLVLYEYTNSSGKKMYINNSVITRNCLIKSYSSNAILKYVGFVHSGNYCITRGTLINTGMTTNADVPAYKKYEFNVNINGLNGIPDSSSTHCSVYDTKDLQSVGVINDLSTLEWTNNSGSYSATIIGIKPSTIHLLATKYLGSQMSVDENGVLTITTSYSPTGLLYFELEVPIETGQSIFEPIPLKVNNEWIVNDMGSEYFIQPEGTNCPVNQVSYYYENLKDKLVNLGVKTVKSIAWSSGLPQLEAIQINNESYSVVPGQINENTTFISCNYPKGYKNIIGIGNFENSSFSKLYNGNANSIFIGNNASTHTPSGWNNGDSIVVIGHGAKGQFDSVTVGINARGSYEGVAVGKDSGNLDFHYNVSVGRSAQASAARAIAIGYSSKNYIENTISFDTNANADTAWRTIQLYNPTKVFFRNEQNQAEKATLELYESGHFLSEYINNNTLQQETGTNKFYLEWTDSNNYKTITKNVADGTETVIDKKITGMHITVKLANNTICGFDLLPYDSSSAYISYAVCDSSGTVMSAYLDSDGVVIISNVPVSTTVSEVKYWLR